jgi:predicted methyltransferase
LEITLSHHQTHPLLHHRGDIKTLAVSPDLGLTTVQVHLDSSGVRFPGGESISWDILEEISAHENNCYIIEEGSAYPIKTFSEHTNRPISLYPTAGAPTLLISGIPMHRIKDTTPDQDTMEKIKAIGPKGNLLDTATGLGYTAIAAARSAELVTTIEFDPAVLDIASDNPWSRDLFDSPRIVQLVGDSYDYVESFESETYDGVIHDPPTMSLAGHLYGRDFYTQLYRVMKPGGRLFHYIGDPESRSRRNITRGVINRLADVGFTRILRAPKAFGVVAGK